MAVGLFLGAALVTYALTSFFTRAEVVLSPEKKSFFEIEVRDCGTPGLIGPGESFETSPTVYNNATEEMYVFMKVEMPVVGGELLYSFTKGAEWVEVEDGVYAYGGDKMTVLGVGDSTPALTSAMKMRDISRAEYSALSDLSIKITGYAIGTEDVETNPADAWNVCKGLAESSKEE